MAGQTKGQTNGIRRVPRGNSERGRGCEGDAASRCGGNKPFRAPAVGQLQPQMVGPSVSFDLISGETLGYERLAQPGVGSLLSRDLSRSAIDHKPHTGIEGKRRN